MNIEEIRKGAPEGATHFKLVPDGNKKIKYYKILFSEYYSWQFRKWVRLKKIESKWGLREL